MTSNNACHLNQRKEIFKMEKFTVEELTDNGISFNIMNQYNSEDEQTKIEAEHLIFHHFLFEILDIIPYDDIVNERWSKIAKTVSDCNSAKILESKFPGYSHNEFLKYYVILKNAMEFVDQIYYYEKEDVELSFAPIEIAHISDESLRMHTQLFFLAYVDIIQNLKAASK